MTYLIDAIVDVAFVALAVWLVGWAISREYRGRDAD
jgi:hypothetical protein